MSNNNFNRYTFRDSDGTYLVSETDCYATEDCYTGDAIERLAKCKDSILLPKQVMLVKTIVDSTFGDTNIVERIIELLKADRDGRLAVLPCKVGDTLYEVTGRKTISEYRVKAIRVELFCVFIEWEIEKGFVWQSLSGIAQGEIGKTVFLTREEAEKALEAMKDE